MQLISFDADKLEVTVKFASNNEKIKTFNNQERQLIDKDIIIINGKNQHELKVKLMYY